MATPSTPPNPADDKPQNSVSEAVQPQNEEQKSATIEPAKETSVFVNSEPIRAEQVENAIKFLSHPKVRGSPVMYRRSFLERKGLTKEEIDEAFRRVPDPPPPVSTSQPTTNEGSQLNPALNTQTQAPAQSLQPAAAAPASAVSKAGTLMRFHWSHALLAVGVLVVSGAGTAVVFKNAVVPRLKSWIRKVVLEEEKEVVQETNSKPSLAEEATAAAKAAAAAAADVARASQEMIISNTQEKRKFEELMNLLNAQVQEMKSMSTSIRKLEGQTQILGQEYSKVPVTSSRQSYANGSKADYDTRSARSSSPPASVEPSNPPHPKSYMDIMAMVQRGERPPNIREINDLPPNPDQPVSNPRIAPRPKPWEAASTQNFPSGYFQQEESFESMNTKFQDTEIANQFNGGDDSPAPWWQRKNVRITELETDERSGPANGRPPPQRSWVPPQPPPVAMPEAAAAIRQPKKLPQQQERLTDEMARSSSSSSDIITDELQRITRISESGGAVDANGGSSGLQISEIQEEA